MSQIEWIKNNINLSSVLPISKSKYSNCPFCGKKNKWVTIKDKVGKCYSPSCSSNINNLKTKDVITAYSLYNNCSIKDTIFFLSQGYKDRFKPLNPLYAFYDRLSRFYHKILLSGEYPAAVQYLKKRKITNFLVRSLRIGFAPDIDDISLYTDNGFTVEELKEYNILSNRLYFKNRVIFPIKDSNNNITHFQGRYIQDIPRNEEGEELFPKYISTKTYKNNNSIPSYLYLENNLSKYEHREPLYICEGIPDTIAMLRYGQQAVGLFGLNGLINHSYKLERFKTIYICADNDSMMDLFTNKRIYKSWSILLPQIQELQLLLPKTNIRLFKPPLSIEGISIKDMENFINTECFTTKKKLEEFIYNYSSDYMEGHIAENIGDLTKHSDLIKLCKLCGRGEDIIKDYIVENNLISLGTSFR